MKLSIDTTNNQQIILKLDHKQRVKTYDSPRSQDLLNLINDFLGEEKVSLKDLSAISVNPGPGAFTSLRVGIAVANALGLALNLPVNGKKAGTILPHYGQPPHITHPKD